MTARFSKVVKNAANLRRLDVLALRVTRESTLEVLVTYGEFAGVHLLQPGLLRKRWRCRIA